MYLPVTGGLLFGIVKYKGLFLIYTHDGNSPRRAKVSDIKAL